MTKSEFDNKYKTALSKMSSDTIETIIKAQKDSVLKEKGELSPDDLFAICAASTLLINQKILKLVLEEILEFDD